MNTETEDKLASAKQQGQAQFDSILEMVEALRECRDNVHHNDADNEKTLEDAEQRIHEDALSVEVRSDWVPAGNFFTEQTNSRAATEPMKPAEYRILLCTGGPAVQIVGRLNEHCEPETAVMQVQDWFQPWTDFHPVFVERDAGEDTHRTHEDVLLDYARCFWFGE